MQSDAIIKRHTMPQKTGLSISTIYARIKAGTFPKPIRLGENSVGWLQSEVDGWLRDRIAESRGIEQGKKTSGGVMP